MRFVGLHVTSLVCALALLGCSAERDAESKTSATEAALSTGGAGTPALLPWSGRDGLGVGLRPAAPERVALGAPAIALSKGGAVFVLDAVNGRLLRVTRGEATVVADVPVDADDLAIGPDGALAVRRSLRPEVLLFDPDGTPAGRVDTSAVEGESISLGLARRVAVTTPFQETFTVGSPRAPQLAEAVLAAKREGAALLGDGAGVVAVRRDDGELELRARGARREVRLALGKGAAARVVGASGSIACARVEHVTEGAGGALSVAREVACVDFASQRTVFRTSLPAPGAYLPKRELAFAGGALAFAHATDDGLSITTWTIDGGAR